ncbi:VOC family protein [Dactylosporangium sp. NPDC048998]|uniref:VOC family protein n=1 Tax=Dactylosporangium sp. NPDC048998 TaxID=3363976 RepID=UPI0037212EB7
MYGGPAVSRIVKPPGVGRMLTWLPLDLPHAAEFELRIRGQPQLVTEPTPRIDVANLPAPAEGILVTLFITVREVARSRDFYSRVLGGTVVLDENPCIVRLSNSWIIMNPGGPPTPDKPDISVVDYQPGNTTSIFLNLRVADIQACYAEWRAKGAAFVTPPIDREAEIRCYMRDPDGYLIEVGQSTGLLHGKLAAKRPEDLPG